MRCRVGGTPAGNYAEQPDPKRPVARFGEIPTQPKTVRRTDPGSAEAARTRRLRAQTEWNRQSVVMLGPGGRSRSPTAGLLWTSPAAGASSQTMTFPTRNGSGPCRTIVDARAWCACRAFRACEARGILRRPEFHYVPKRASCLNMVESETGVLRGQCPDRRIATQEQLKSGDRRLGPTEGLQAPASNGCSQPKWS
jgi:hypothetical protein